MTTLANAGLVARLRRLPRWRTLLALLVVALAVVGVLNALGRGGSSPAASSAKSTASKDNRTLLGVLTGLDPAVVRAIGGGGISGTLAKVPDAPALVGASHHPQVVFLSTEGCGPCAAQRWSMVIALSRFGTVKNVLLGLSSSAEATGPLATFSFRNLEYQSSYLDLVAVETTDANGAPLASLSPGDQQVVDRYDAPPYVPEALRGGVPWLDVANRFVMAGSGYPAATIKGLNWSDIAGRLGNSGDPVARAVIGNANWITAAICATTGMTPASVCQAAPIQDLVQRLG